MAVPLKRKHQRKIDFHNVDKIILKALQSIVRNGFLLKNVDLKDPNILCCERSRLLIVSFREISENAKKWKVFLYILQRAYNVPLNLCRYYEIDVNNYEEICWADKENRGKISTYCFPISAGSCEIIKNKKLHHSRQYILS